MKPYFYFIIIFFSLTGLIVYFLLWPAYQQLVFIQSEINSAQESIKVADDYFAEMRKTSERLKNYENQLKILDYALPTKFYLPLMHNFFEETSPKYGLTLNSVAASVNPLAGTSKIKEIPISLNLSGSYSSLKDFITYLENSVRFFALGNMTISGSDSPDKPFNLILNLKTFTR